MSAARRALACLMLLATTVLGLEAPAVGSPSRDMASAAGQPPQGMSFRSMPGFHPPKVTVKGDPDPGSGDIFLTPRNSYQRQVAIQHGPMVIDGQGQLVWFDQLRKGLAMNLEVQRYQGHPVLTWWQGTSVSGEDVIVDDTYRTVATLHPGHGYDSDAHEFQLTARGTALISAMHRVKADLTAVHGPKHGLVDDDIVQELDIKTGKVLWEWHSYGQVPLGDSYARPVGSEPFDYFHLNSIQQLPGGRLLISARDTWAVYELDKRTGKIIWTLGGKHSSFALGPRARFSWQHDARLSGHRLTLFDDASDGPREEEAESSAKVLKLNMTRMGARMVRRYTHRPALLSVSQGNVQTLPNHDLFVGWGADPQFSEYSPAGRQVFNGRFQLGVNTYRAYRFPWVGRPTWPPLLDVARSSDGAVTVRASWNGATEVAAWRVLGGTSPGSLATLTQSPRTGFETAIHVKTAATMFAVQALDAQGNVLGTSKVSPG